MPLGWTASFEWIKCHRSTTDGAEEANYNLIYCCGAVLVGSVVREQLVLVTSLVEGWKILHAIGSLLLVAVVPHHRHFREEFWHLRAESRRQMFPHTVRLRSRCLILCPEYHRSILDRVVELLLLTFLALTALLARLLQLAAALQTHPLLEELLASVATVARFPQVSDSVAGHAHVQLHLH